VKPRMGDRCFESNKAKTRPRSAARFVVILMTGSE
jgi:hypothetical protein